MRKNKEENLKQRDRYNTEGMVEAGYEPGSGKRVLKNLVSVKRKREMDILEFDALAKTLEDSLHIYDMSHKFTSVDICNLHKLWLGNLYTWAGSYRQVNMSKDGFPFAAANLIPSLMKKFDKSQLERFTPCNFSTQQEVIEALAVVHNEFILIHPFREGNGRVGRLLATLMAVQAGLPPLDFGGIQGKKKQGYFSAVQEGLANNYLPMIEVFAAVVKRTLRINH